MTPADLLLAFFGRGPATRMACVGLLLGRGYKYDQAEAEVGQALLALTRAGRIESFSDDCFRIAAGTPMESDRREPVSPWRQYRPGAK